MLTLPPRAKDSRAIRIALSAILLVSIVFVIAQNVKFDRADHHEPTNSNLENLAADDNDVSAEPVFSNIYDKRLWGKQGGGSGEGSSMQFTTRTRALVEMLVYKYDIDLLVDAPCGAMTWMPSVLKRIHAARPSFKYLGIDVVPGVIKNNTEKFDEKYMSFRQYDFSEGPIKDLPRSSRSAIFCRDALQHLSYSTITDALESFVQTSVDYIIIGSYYKHGTLQNIKNGDYFPFDVSKIKNFPKPIDVIEEETADHKHMVIFERNDFKNYDLRKNMMKSLSGPYKTK